MCGDNCDFLQGYELLVAWCLLAVSWFWNESSTVFFHIHVLHWHCMQLYKSPATKFCSAIPQAVHLLLIMTIIYIEPESFTSRLRPGWNIKQHKDQLSTKNTQDQWSCLSYILPPTPMAEVTEQGQAGSWGRSRSCLSFYALTSFLFEAEHTTEGQGNAFWIFMVGTIDHFIHEFSYLFNSQSLSSITC